MKNTTGSNRQPRGSVCHEDASCKACRQFRQLYTKSLRPVHPSAYQELRQRGAA